MKRWVENLVSAALIASITLVFSLTLCTLVRDGGWSVRDRKLPPQLSLSVEPSAGVPAAPAGQETAPAAPEGTSDAPERAETTPEREEAAAVPHREAETPAAPAPERSLLIGDSRAVGLAEYGGLEEMDFFASVGLNVYILWDTETEVGERGKTGLEDLLSDAQYDKIYLMLGINELGYDQDRTVETYTAAVEQIQSLQPEAQVCLLANLHVTQRRGEGDPIYNNANLDALNARIARIADERELAYLDVNPLFDDENGALDSRYTSDGVHLLARHDGRWAEWLVENS